MDGKNLPLALQLALSVLDLHNDHDYTLHFLFLPGAYLENEDSPPHPNSLLCVSEVMQELRISLKT